MESTVQGNWSNADGDWQLKRLQQDSVKTVEKIIEVVREALQQDVMRIDREYEQMFGPSSAQFSEYLNMVIERLAQSGVTSQGIVEWLSNAATDGTVADDRQAFSRHMQSQTIPHIPGGITTKEALPVIQADEALTYNPWQPDIPLVAKSAKNGSLAGAISGSYNAPAPGFGGNPNPNGASVANAGPTISQFDEPMAPPQPVTAFAVAAPVPVPAPAPVSSPAPAAASPNSAYSAYTAWGAPIPEIPAPAPVVAPAPTPVQTAPAQVSAPAMPSAPMPAGITPLTAPVSSMPVAQSMPPTPVAPPPMPVAQPLPVVQPAPVAQPVAAAPITAAGGFQYQDPGHIPMPSMPALNNQLQVQIPLPQTYGNGNGNGNGNGHQAMHQMQAQQQIQQPQPVQQQQANLRNVPIPVGNGTAQAEAEREMARKKEEGYAFDLSTAWD